MLTTLILCLSALGALALGWCLCRAATPLPPPPQREAGRPHLPVTRSVWLEVDDDPAYDRARFDQAITRMLRETAQWQRTQPPQEVTCD